MYIYEQNQQGPTKLPARYFHENVYIEPNQMFTIINLDKYLHIYSTLSEIKTVCANTSHNTNLKIEENRINREYKLKKFHIINNTIGWKFMKKDMQPLTSNVYLMWNDTYLGLQQTTVFQVTDHLELVRSFNRQKIVFHFGPYENNYKLMIVSRGFADAFCGSDIVNVDDWCLDNVDQNVSSLNSTLRDNTYIMPRHNKDFVVLTFSATNANSTISPILRLLISIRIFNCRFHR
ncbi:hypothetical protein RF11_13573 [Thelohanellus kitauei]|uniref:Uncharacterized protein n=1 Tax=Thelohanellus kitauei TaxID=669202 RepID=A0A0C2J5C3_THEKT|nr:hypothetical protein RF11_13573 [Thelohanellus kitauei]